MLVHATREGSGWSYTWKLSFLVDGSASDLISKDSIQRELESIYLSISLDISFLASYVHRRHQGINMHPWLL